MELNEMQFVDFFMTIEGKVEVEMDLEVEVPDEEEPGCFVYKRETHRYYNNILETMEKLTKEYNHFGIETITEIGYDINSRIFVKGWAEH